MNSIIKLLTAGTIILWGVWGCSRATDPDEIQNEELTFNGAKVVKLSSLPDCDSDTEGALYYVLEDSEFRYCDGSELITIDLRGDSGLAGEDGISLNWLGSMEEKPDSPELFDVYYNSTDKKVYLWGGSSWDQLVQDGSDGNSCDAVSIDEGIVVSCGGNVVDTILHGTDGTSGDPGNDGTSCSAANIEGGIEVSCAGEVVDTLEDGTDGTDGTNGDPGNDGTSCSATTIEGGIEVSCAGEVVDTLVDGTDGTPIIWQGQTNTAPVSPEINWAYFNIGDNVSYIWDGEEWDTLAVGGQDFDPDVDTIHVDQITGLIGQGFTLEFPDVLHSTTSYELEGVVINDRVLIISGPGWDTERIEGFTQGGDPLDNPGLSQEHPILIEVAGDDTTAIQAYFDSYTSGDTPKSMSIVIEDASDSERTRWNCFDFEPHSYGPGNDGRVRFEYRQKNVPDNVSSCVLESDIFGSLGSYNPDTDTEVEVAGITGDKFFPELEIDSTVRTLTFTYGLDDGSGIYGWARNILEGIHDKRTISVIYRDGGGTESLRLNYYNTWPMKFESIEGYGLDTTIKVRVTVSFDTWQEAGS